MDNFIKIYEEQIPLTLEEVKNQGYKCWLNEILDDEGIEYENKYIFKLNELSHFAVPGGMVIEVYVLKDDEQRVLEIISLYRNSEEFDCD